MFVLRTDQRRATFEQYLCDAHGQAKVNEIISQRIGPPRQAAIPSQENVAFDIELVVVQQNSNLNWVYLFENAGPARLVLGIGWCEAVGLQRQLRGVSSDRPQTPNVVANIITSLGATLTRVLIDSVVTASPEKRIYHAKLILERSNDIVVVDSRPSDALAFAVQFYAPILVAPDVVQMLRAAAE